MLAAGEGRDESLFRMHEPCHCRESAPTLHNCSELMREVLRCDFGKIDWFPNMYWDHFRWGYGTGYSPALYSEVCRNATLRIIKTVNAHDLQREVFPVLESLPELRVVNVVRDPRGAYMSAKAMKLDPLLSLNPEYIGLDGAAQSAFQRLDAHNRWRNRRGENLEYLRYLCNALVNATNVTHPRMLTVRFEDLVSGLAGAVRKVVALLDLPWDGQSQRSARKFYPRLRAGASWARINHHRGGKKSWWSGIDVAWTARELAELDGPLCRRALGAWRYL